MNDINTMKIRNSLYRLHQVQLHTTNILDSSTISSIDLFVKIALIAVFHIQVDFVINYITAMEFYDIFV